MVFPQARLWFELIVYASIIAVVRGQPVVRRLLDSLDPFRRRLIQGFILLMVAGQLYDRPERIYPFVSWTMYSNATHPGQKVNRIRARMTDGSVENLPICPFPVQTMNCASTLRLLAKRAADPGSKNPERARKRLAEFERAIAEAYEQQNPGTRIRTLMLDSAQIDLKRVPSGSDLPWRNYYESRPLR